MEREKILEQMNSKEKTFQRDILVVYRNLVVDDTIVQLVMHHLYRIPSYFMKLLHKQWGDISLVGSFREGSWIPHFFSKNIREFETDVMSCVTCDEDQPETWLIRDPSHKGQYGLVDDSKFKTNFLMQLVQKDLLPSASYRHTGKWTLGDMIGGDKIKMENFINGICFHIEQLRTNKNRKMEDWLECLLACFKCAQDLHKCTTNQGNNPMNTDIGAEKDKICTLVFNGQGPANQMGIKWSGGEGRKITAYSMDVVFSHKLPTWPEDLQKDMDTWIKRERKWPDINIIQAAIQQGCHLVYKPNKTPHGSLLPEAERAFDYQVSFVSAEITIADARTMNQRLVYFMAKCLYYRHLKKEEDSTVSSYVLKTAMMWLLEETPVEDWTDQNSMHNLQRLLLKLHRAVQTGTMPHYFLSGKNILSTITPDIQQIWSTALLDVIDNLEEKLDFRKCDEPELIELATRTDCDGRSELKILQNYLDSTSRLLQRLQSMYNNGDMDTFHTMDLESMPRRSEVGRLVSFCAKNLPDILCALEGMKLICNRKETASLMHNPVNFWNIFTPKFYHFTCG